MVNFLQHVRVKNGRSVFLTPEIDKFILPIFGGQTILTGPERLVYFLTDLKDRSIFLRAPQKGRMFLDRP